MSAILGTGTYLFVDQAHYLTGDPKTVEGGQLIFMRIAEPKVESVVINDGSAQRSKVNSITVTFSTQVTVGAGAFELKAADGSSVQLNVSTSVVNGKTVAVISFAGPGIVGGSLADGNYTFTVHGDKVTDSLGQRVDADGDDKLGGDLSTAFKRLFGDLDGDGQVSGQEVATSAHSNGAKAGGADYLWFLDYDGNGKIDGKDHREVARNNNGKK